GRQPDKDEGWLYALIQGCSVFYDVGCNWGVYSLLACATSPNRRAIALDANPEALAIAAHNLFLNGISDRVRFGLGFVSNTEDEQVDFYALGAGAASSRYPSRSRRSPQKARTTTLDAIAEQE